MYHVSYISSDAKMLQRRQEQGSGLNYLVDRLTNSDLKCIVFAEKYLQPSKKGKVIPLQARCGPEGG